MLPRCDPCGLVCVAFVYIITFYTDYAYVQWVLPTFSQTLVVLTNAIIYQVLVVLVLWSHFKASLSDPGFVSQSAGYPLSPSPDQAVQIDPSLREAGCISSLSNNKKNRDTWSVCQKCETYRPPRAHHCRICRKCIRKMDHHCPWINNCVGEFNQKYFIQFLFYVAVMCLYTVTSTAIFYMKTEEPSQIKVMHTIVLLVESLLFGIFVTAVLTDQLQAVFTDATTVERCSQSKSVTKKSKAVLLAELCGPGHPIMWFLPCRKAITPKRQQFVV